MVSTKSSDLFSPDSNSGIPAKFFLDFSHQTSIIIYKVNLFFMSKTKRKPNPYEDKKWKKTRDKKPFYKPGSASKQAYKKKDDAKPKQKLKEAIAHGDDFDGVILREAKRHHAWDWN